MNPPTLTATYTYNPSTSPPLSSSDTATNNTTNTTISTSEPSKTFTHELPPPPSHTNNSRNVDHHIEPLHTEPDLQSRTHHLHHLHAAVINMQKEINAFLTEKMEEEKQLLANQQLGLVGGSGKLMGDVDEMEVEEEEELDEETKRLEAEVERQRREDELEAKARKEKRRSGGGGKREKGKK